MFPPVWCQVVIRSAISLSNVGSLHLQLVFLRSTIVSKADFFLFCFVFVCFYPPIAHGCTKRVLWAAFFSVFYFNFNLIKFYFICPEREQSVNVTVGWFVYGALVCCVRSVMMHRLLTTLQPCVLSALLTPPPAHFVERFRSLSVALQPSLQSTTFMCIHAG